MKVHTVLYDCDRNDGLGDAIARFRSKKDATRFAAKHTHYGKPATVDSEDVPNRIASRWSFMALAPEGK